MVDNKEMRFSSLQMTVPLFHSLEKTVESLSTDVFEPWTSTESRNFSLTRITHFLLKIFKL